MFLPKIDFISLLVLIRSHQKLVTKMQWQAFVDDSTISRMFNK